MTPDDLRAEAEECRQTASGPCGEYGTAFWVAAIVLDNLAKRLEASPTPTQKDPHHGR